MQAFGDPKEPMEVFLTLLAMLLVSFVVTILTLQLFSTGGLRSGRASHEALFNYIFGTLILAILLPAIAVYFQEFKWVTMVGINSFLLATVWFNRVVENKETRGGE